MKFEVFKSSDGKFRWHLREANGRVVAVRRGKVRLPPTSGAESRRVRNATQHALSMIAADSAKA